MEEPRETPKIRRLELGWLVVAMLLVACIAAGGLYITRFLGTLGFGPLSRKPFDPVGFGAVYDAVASGALKPSHFGAITLPTRWQGLTFGDRANGPTQVYAFPQSVAILWDSRAMKRVPDQLTEPPKRRFRETRRAEESGQTEYRDRRGVKVARLCLSAPAIPADNRDCRV